MPDHARKQVRQAAVSDLTGLVTTGANVFNARVKPIDEHRLPCLNVFLLDENSDWDAAGTILRTGDLVIEGRAFAGDTLFDVLDGIAAEVETAIYAETPALDRLLCNIGTPRTQMEIADTSQGADRRIGIIRILFPVQYRTRQGDPTAIV
ncbi:MAG: hypothetical protein KIT02_10305 [Devosia sp.]|uniref:hypothetical protein n=1 Tax=Devosia sp. TaxID=1871048 RepID=UPI0024C9C1DB|nr:hypothetical protein [Devosia sp.]UYN98358.1 MAG: hypothetical protein KIT02_10305 [Devosia sp.]